MTKAKFKTQVARFQHRSCEERKTLGPEFGRRVDAVLQALEAKHWIPVIFHGRRTQEQQAEKVKQGYSPTMQSWHVESTHKSARRFGVFYEIRGEAADIVDARYLWSGPAADTKYQFWRDLGEAAKQQGLVWGGDWRKPDVAHVELLTRTTSQRARTMLA
jgi:peptidoglycan L-alanyl-D-glutamate endopeptidase CwlK